MARRTILSLLALAVAALGADPVIGTITVKPTFAPSGTATQVTLTAVITDPTLSANGANVQRLNAAGNPTAVLGLLHDDGLNGDLIAGDHIYTLVFTLNESSAGPIFFRATGAFQGISQRVPSSSIAVDIANAASPLTIDGTATPVPNAAGWNNSNVIVTFSCAGGAGGSDTCPGIARVTTEGTAQAIPGVATDGSGNTATKTVMVNLDKTGPVLSITSPANGTVVATPTLTLAGTVTDPVSGVASFTCNGQTTTINGSDFSCNLPLVPGSNAITVQATDVAGNTSTANLTVTFSVTTLTISGSATPPPNGVGWNNSDVTVAFACAGGALPVNCPPTVVVSNESASQIISRTATDALGSTATASVTLKIDKTRPTLSITSPAAAATVTTPQLTVTGTVTDTLSGLARVTCNNAAAVVNGSSFSCNLTLVSGQNAIAVQATDVAGNVATSNVSVTLGNALTISATPSPAPNAAGWNNSNVTVTFTCAGGVGTVTCPQPVIVTTEAASQVISRTASDNGGNSATASVTLKIDKTPPVLAITSPASGATVANPQLTITGTLTDTLSGVSSATCGGSPGTVTPGNLSCSRTLIAGLNTIIVQAVDVAGNSTAISLPVTLNTPPLTISATPSPAPNAAGWNNSDVTVTFACAGGTGSLTCPQPVTVSTEGANQTISRTVADNSGNSATTSITLRIDKTTPTLSISSPISGATITTPQVTLTGTAADALSGIASITCNGSPATLTQSNVSCNVTLTPGSNTLAVRATDVAGNVTNASVSVAYSPITLTITSSVSPTPNAAGWNDTDVTVTFTCGGGVGAITCPQPVVVSTEGANQVISRTATDSGGNSASASVTLKIDKTAPTVAISSPTSGATVTTPQIIVTGTITDALSGATSVTCNGAATVLTQSNVACNVTLTAGANTIVVQAKDVAGNAATTSIPVTFSAQGLQITSSVSPTPNPAGWNNTNATVTFTCLGGVGTTTCPQPVVVSTEGDNQVISRTATDSGGNSATASVTLKIDKTAPTVTISSPTSGATVTTAQITVTGTITDTLSGITSVTCNGAATTLTQSNLSCSVTLVAGSNTIIVQATDVAGNVATTSIPVTFTPQGLSITSLVSPTPNAAGWNNSNVTVTFTCSGGSGTITCPQPVVVSTEGASQVISRTATDTGGNSATASVTLKIDKTAPTVAINSPTSGATVTTTQVTVIGTITDILSGTSNVTCNGAVTTLAQSALSCNVTLVLGPNTITVVATDIAGNVTTSTLNLTYLSPLMISLSTPTNLSYLNISPTTVSGTVSDSSAVVTINSISAPVSNGNFSVQVPLAEGPNILTATATGSGGAVATASIQVTLDTTPPHVTITTPPDKFVTTATSITVAGTVNDIVVGTVNSQQAAVTVNGTPAQVSNRTFLVPSVGLNLGDNVIQAVAVDRVGNSATTQITVTRQAPALSQITAISGDGQTGTIGSTLPSSLVVSVTGASGSPLPNTPVIFKITQNNGMLTAGGQPAATVVATTNAQGQAQAQWTLGFRAGAGGNTVEAYSVGIGGTAIFTATGNQGPAGMIVIDSGNTQISAINQPLPKPLIAAVVDSGNNRLSGVPVTFTVKQGGGSFGGQPTFTINTDSDGRAAATLTLGFQEGESNNIIVADFAGNQGVPASFAASGRAPGVASKTTISGLVLDNTNLPIPGVTVRAMLTNQLSASSSTVQSAATVTTDVQGQFNIPQAPIGFVKLLIDGSTAKRTGSYPSLEYDLVTVSGQNNTVGQSIYLLPISTANQLCLTATTGGGTLTIPEAPGFSLTFAPGQVTFPGGSKTGCVSVTVVHPDRVPMVPGFGQQPRFIVTIQPSGALFNPPAPITLPNVDGLKPREVTEMYSFDHDIGSFVAIGTGTVSDDGQVIRSNPGVGVLKAGWHCGGNPTVSGAAAQCGPCAYCDGNTCQPTNTGNSCLNTCIVGNSGMCAGGRCSPQTGGQYEPLGTACGVNGQCDGKGNCSFPCSGPNCTGCPVCNSGNFCIDDTCVNGQCFAQANSLCQNVCQGKAVGASCTVTTTAGSQSGTCDANGTCNLCGATGSGSSCVSGGVIGMCSSSGQCCTNGSCPVTVTISSGQVQVQKLPNGYTDAILAAIPSTPGGTYSWTSDNSSVASVQNPSSGMNASSVSLAIGQPGTANISVSYTDPNGAQAQDTISVVLTADVTVVGWINNIPITEPTAADGVSQSLIDDLSSAAKCPVTLAAWALAGQNGTAPLPTIFDVQTSIDRKFANSFLIDNSYNPDPGPQIDPSSFPNQTFDYRAYNRFQAFYTVRGGQIDVANFLVQDARAGSTPDPCFHLTISNPFALPEIHSQNGTGFILPTSVELLNEARLGSEGQAVNTYLNNRGGVVSQSTPWIWSLIKFGVDGTLVTPFVRQIFPTYTIYGTTNQPIVLTQSDLQSFINLNSSSQYLLP